MKNKHLNYKHGLSRTKIYNVWRDMNSRCYRTKHIHYSNYGGKGIKVCDEWRDVVKFKKWFDTLGINENELGINKLTLDRKDPNGNYEPNNCRFVKNTVQARNTKKIMSTNMSGYRGVNIDKYFLKFRASISINDKLIHMKLRNSRYLAMLDYDNYVKSNKLEHTINDLTLNKIIKTKNISGITLMYTPKNDYYLSSLYTAIFNNGNISKRLMGWVKDNNINLPLITKKLKKLYSELMLDNVYVVVEQALPSIVINVHNTSIQGMDTNPIEQIR